METYATKSDRYASLVRRVESLFEGERDFLANTSNLAAVIFEYVGDVNWVGFYFRQGDELVLGPFQGRAACVRLSMGKGVCGTAAAGRRSLVVENVHQFEGHVACDAASNSELVVPIEVDSDVVGVLDLDSPSVGRFDDDDRAGIEALVAVYLRCTDLGPLKAFTAGP